ncbi:EVE domain-containing protein [Streptomyces sp. NPDC086549]|uniref:EVE domain-containing protein n=1 Tax=Streptomyces sp. NPDC086549 TaxID=3365752 RepID=UPI0037FEBA29
MTSATMTSTTAAGTTMAGTTMAGTTAADTTTVSTTAVGTTAVSREESPAGTSAVAPRRAWLGVVSAEHARIAVRRGFVQLNHGKRHNLARMGRGDGFVFYSPTQRMGDRGRLRAFTALGVIDDDEPYLADEVMNMGAKGPVRPWRRNVRFLPVHSVPLSDVSGELLLTQQPNWGYSLRFGLVSLSVDDFRSLRTAMTP